MGQMSRNEKWGHAADFQESNFWYQEWYMNLKISSMLLDQRCESKVSGVTGYTDDKDNCFSNH